MTAPRSAHRTCLFGGTLLAAGIAANSAHAQSFAHESSDYALFASPIFFGNDTSGSLFGFGSIDRSIADWDGQAVSTTGEISVSQSLGTSGTITSSGAYMKTVTYGLNGCAAQLVWDFGPWPNAVLSVTDLDTATTVFVVDEVTPTGSQVIPLTEGVRYEIIASISGAAPSGESFAGAWVYQPCPADLNADGVLNVDDIDAFVAAFLGGC